MAEQEKLWGGTLPANAEKGVKTGVILNTRDPKITITVTGQASPWRTGDFFDPDGNANRKGDSKALLPGANGGACLMRIGGGPYRLVGKGLTDWTIREDGELVFFYNDDPGEFGDNRGSFAINVTRDQGHFDEIINYKTGDNTTWTARWVGDIFFIPQRDQIQGALSIRTRS